MEVAKGQHGEQEPSDITDSIINQVGICYQLTCLISHLSPPCFLCSL